MNRTGAQVWVTALMAAGFVLLCGTNVYGDTNFSPTTSAEIDIDGTPTDVYKWHEEDNWDNWDSTNNKPVSDRADITSTGSEAAVLTSGTVHGHDVRIGRESAGQLDIRLPDAETFETQRIFYVDNGSGGTANLYSGTHLATGGSYELRIGNHSASGGVYNVRGGTLDVRKEVGVGYQASGILNVYDGSISVASGNNVVVGRNDDGTEQSGTFNVAGSAPSSISLGGNWIQGVNGTLQVGIDSGVGGVEMIDVAGDVEFDSGAVVDVGFLDGYEEIGSWKVMEWDGGETGLDNLSLDSGAGENWVLHKNTTNSGNLTVEYVPEPGSLALLLVGTGLLFTGRRRRRN